jgi:ABC-type uncharacterized transport system involved in gliding motility auxiliary subunit
MKTNRQTQLGAYAGTYTLIVLAVIVAANYLASTNDKTYDATANKRYTLSEQTEKIVKGLQKEVRVTYWDSAEAFPRAKDLLERYANLSGKLKVDYIDGNKKPGLAREAGVSQAGTITVNAGMKKEEAKSLSEEEITGAIIRVIKDKERTVCLTTGAGERSTDDSSGNGYSAAKDLLLKDNYKLDTINLIEKAEIPERCTVVLVPGPRFDLTKAANEALQKRVEAGGRVLFMLDAPLQLGKQPISPNKELMAILAGWGVTLNNDLVIDLSGIGQAIGLSAAAPLVTTFTVHPIVRDFRNASAAMLLTQSVDGKGTEKTTVEPLYSTSRNSFATTNLKAAEIEPNPEKDKRGPLNLAVAGSYRTGKENNQGRFVVTGSSGFASNSLIGFQSNRDLLLNMVAWLASDEDLISIRPKDPEDRRLQMNRSQLLGIRTVSQFVLPLIVVGMAIFVWSKRR